MAVICILINVPGKSGEHWSTEPILHLGSGTNLEWIPSLRPTLPLLSYSAICPHLPLRPGCVLFSHPWVRKCCSPLGTLNFPAPWPCSAIPALPSPLTTNPSHPDWPYTNVWYYFLLWGLLSLFLIIQHNFLCSRASDDPLVHRPVSLLTCNPL